MYLSDNEGPEISEEWVSIQKNLKQKNEYVYRRLFLLTLNFYDKINEKIRYIFLE